MICLEVWDQFWDVLTLCQLMNVETTWHCPNNPKVNENVKILIKEFLKVLGYGNGMKLI